MIKSNGKIENTEIVYYIYTPEREINPKAILQIAIEQDDILAEFLTSNGVIVCGVDDNTINNQHLMYEFMRKKYRRLPYILMGNTTVQLYMQSSNYGNEIDGVILYGISSDLGFIQSIKSFFKDKPKKDWANHIPLSLPVFVIENQSVYDQLADAELNDISMIQSESKEDILAFINRVYDGIIEAKIL